MPWVLSARGRGSPPAPCCSWASLVVVSIPSDSRLSHCKNGVINLFWRDPGSLILSHFTCFPPRNLDFLLKTQAFHCPPKPFTLCCFCFQALFLRCSPKSQAPEPPPIRGHCSPAPGSIPTAGRAPAAPSVTRPGQHSPWGAGGCGCRGVSPISSCNVTHPAPAALFSPPVGRGRRTSTSLYFCWENYTLVAIAGAGREGAEGPAGGAQQPHWGGRVSAPQKRARTAQPSLKPLPLSLSTLMGFIETLCKIRETFA